MHIKTVGGHLKIVHTLQKGCKTYKYIPMYGVQIAFREFDLHKAVDRI
jgi:hypothetical protein